MANQLLQTKFSISKDPSTLVGTNIIIIKPKGIEDPFAIIDNQNSVNASDRTLGADLSSVVTKEYPIENQLTAVKYTVGATVAAETITYAQEFDLSSGFFNSADQPILAFGIYLISGVATTTLAQRKVSLTMTDTAGSPVVFSNGGGVDVDEFDYILGNESNTTQDLTGYNEAIVIPLDKIQVSTTKKFTVQLKFNLPATSQFVLYKEAFYRSPEDCGFVRPADIIIENPKAFTETPTPNVGEMKGALGNTLGFKQRTTTYAMTFESDELVDEHARILMRNKKYTGGKIPSNRVELDIPSIYPYEISSGVANLQNVNSTKDIWVQIKETSGTIKGTKVIEGGEYLPKQTVRFYNVAPTKRLRFSPVDAGKKAIVQVNYSDPDAVYEAVSARGKIVYCDVIRILSDNTDLNTSRRRELRIYKNMTVNVTTNGASVDNDNPENLKYEVKSVTANINQDLYERHYIDA
jgi:hypothetical protein